MRYAITIIGDFHKGNPHIMTLTTVCADHDEAQSKAIRMCNRLNSLLQVENGHGHAFRIKEA